MVFIWLRLVHSGLCLSNYDDEKKVPWSKDGKKTCAVIHPRMGIIVMGIWIRIKYPAGGFNHLENISQWEGLSHILWKIKNVWNHLPEWVYESELSINGFMQIPQYGYTIQLLPILHTTFFLILSYKLYGLTTGGTILDNWCTKLSSPNQPTW